MLDWKEEITDFILVLTHEIHVLTEPKNLMLTWCGAKGTHP